MLLAQVVVPDVYPPTVMNRTLFFIYFQCTWEISQTKPTLSATLLQKRLLRLQIQTLKIRKKEYYFWQEIFDLLSVHIYCICKVMGCLPY